MHLFVALHFVLLADIVLGDYLSRFEKFKSKYGKRYSNSNDEQERYEIYQANLELIEKHNNDPACSYRMAMNQFGDMTLDEFVSWFAPPLNQTSNSDSMMELEQSQLGEVADSVDWTTTGAITIIEQAQCRSNYALISAAAIQSSWAIHNSELIPTSAQQLMDCTRYLGNDGGDVRAALRYAIIGPGMCSTQAYPYTGRRTDLCRDNRCTPLVKIHSFHDLLPNNEYNLKLAVFTQPIISYISIDDPGIMFYSSGVYNGACSNNARHAVVIVGYGEDEKTGELYWKVGSTWGAGWGENSYIRMSRSTSKTSPGKCAIASTPIYIQTY